jgi:hypothetical protein
MSAPAPSAFLFSTGCLRCEPLNKNKILELHRPAHYRYVTVCGHASPLAPQQCMRTTLPCICLTTQALSHTQTVTHSTRPALVEERDSWIYVLVCRTEQTAPCCCLPPFHPGLLPPCSTPHSIPWQPCCPTDGNCDDILCTSLICVILCWVRRYLSHQLFGGKFTVASPCAGTWTRIPSALPDTR